MCRGELPLAQAPKAPHLVPLFVYNVVETGGPMHNDNMPQPNAIKGNAAARRTTCRAALAAFFLAAVVAIAPSCAPTRASEGDSVLGRAASSVATVMAAVAHDAAEPQAAGSADDTQSDGRVPLTWDVANAQLVGRQGTTALWGTCGECCIANTLNLVTGSSLTEADIVDYVFGRGLCVPETGGMTIDDMAEAYTDLLPDHMDVHGYAGTYAPPPDELAALLEGGTILNVGVYGEMMREGGHVGEGDVAGTHWIVVHAVERSDDGGIKGFHVVDSASDITYLTAQDFLEVYYGHDGTTVIDPTCIEVYGLR